MYQIAEIIKYEGDSNTFVWKHPCEDFNSFTQLIVHENQEAIFFMNGQAQDLFGPGRYTLETQNIPILGKLLNRTTGNNTPFHCEVYFINKAVNIGMKWGTDSRVHFVDPISGIPLDIGASGELNLRVCDSRKLLVSLVGNDTGLSVVDTQKTAIKKAFSIGKATEVVKTVQNCFRAPLMTVIKSHLASVIREQKINILEADAYLETLSQELLKKVQPAFEAYGLTVPQFYVTTIALPEDDKNFQDMKALISKAYLGVKTEEIQADVALAAQKRKLVEEQTEAQLKIIRAQGEAEAAKARGMAEAEVMRAKGYTEKDVLEADVQKAYAEGLGNFGSNVGSGGGGNAGTDILNMMASLKVAETMLGKMDNILTPQHQEQNAPAATVQSWVCSCGETGNTKNFCMNCGQPKPAAQFCTGCGEKLMPGARFCPNCGQKR